MKKRNLLDDGNTISGYTVNSAKHVLRIRMAGAGGAELYLDSREQKHFLSTYHRNGFIYCRSICDDLKNINLSFSKLYK